MKIALVMIARDEARCIERCLRTARPFVDEMHVLDTGSADATPRIAAAAGARVHAFRWVDDFAAARNAALDCSDADWNLVLDADEQLVDGGQWLRSLCTQAPFLGVVRIDNQFDGASGLQTAHSGVSRLLPRGVRYTGRIHEQPDSPLPRRATPLRVLHDGYRAAQLRHKQGRNLMLLQQALNAHPDDAYFLYQLGREHDVQRDYAAACEAFARAASLAPPTAPWRHDLVVRHLHALTRCGRHGDAVQIAEVEMPNWSASPDYHFVLGDLLLDWAVHEPERAADLLPMIEATWQQCLRIGEQPALEGAVAGRGSHLAAHNLAVYYESLGRADEARHHRRLAEQLPTD